MKTCSLALLGLSLIACGGKPATDSGTDTGGTLVDADNDGFTADSDCDDSNADINPDADEVCDGFDNNCDELVDDESAVDAAAWYADADADTYGDFSTSVTSCEQPDGFVDNDSDCNDADAAVNPDAIEVCDGIDNDCDTGTLEDGMVTHVDGDGLANDVSSDFAGTMANPASFTLSEGELHFCDGTFYTALTVDGDAMIGSLNEDPTKVMLDGAGSVRPITVSGVGLEVSIADVMVTGGQGVADDLSQLLGGDAPAAGGIGCLGYNFDEDPPEEVTTNLTVENVIVMGNSAQTVGGLYTLGCNLTLTNSEVSNNTGDFIGGLMTVDGEHTITGVEVVDNDAQGYAAGAFIVMVQESGVVTLDDTVVSGNVNTGTEGGFEGGVLAFVGGMSGGSQKVTWTGTTGSQGSGIWGNTAPEYGALELYSMVDFEADTLDFGSVDEGTGNTDLDIEWTAFGPATEYWVGYDDASFTCGFDADYFTCGSSTETMTADPTTTVAEYDGFDYWMGLGFDVDSTGTLESFDVYSKANGSNCDIEFILVSTPALGVSSDPTSVGDWDIEWQSTVSLPQTPGWVNSGQVGRVLDSTRTYGWLVATDSESSCRYSLDYNIDYGYDYYYTGVCDGAVSVPGLGSTRCGYLFGYGPDSDEETVNLDYIHYLDVAFAFRFHTTEL